MSNEENFDLVRRFNQVWVTEDLDVLDEILAPDFVAHNGDEDVHGPDGWRRFVQEAVQQGEVETGQDEVIGDGGLVAERWWWRGRIDGGELRGHGVTLHRIENGRLQANWAVFHPDE